jgi:anti-sigma B factor antagonist
MIEEVSGQREGLRAADFFKAGELTVRSDRDGVVHTICVEGELDLASAERLERELTRVEATDVLSIILDLSGLTFIDSTGVRLLLSANARSRADSDRLALLRGPAAVQRVFQLTGILDRLPFADDRAHRPGDSDARAKSRAAIDGRPLEQRGLRAGDPRTTPAAQMAPTEQTVRAQPRPHESPRARAEVQRRVGQAVLASAIRALASSRMTTRPIGTAPRRTPDSTV